MLSRARELWLHTNVVQRGLGTLPPGASGFAPPTGLQLCPLGSDRSARALFSSSPPPGPGAIKDQAFEVQAQGESRLNKPNAELAEARAELDKAESKLDKAESKLDKARAELDKARAELDKARAELDKARADGDAESIRVARAGVNSAQGGVDSAQGGVNSAQGLVDAMTKQMARLVECASEAPHPVVEFLSISAASSLDHPQCQYLAMAERLHQADPSLAERLVQAVDQEAHGTSVPLAILLPMGCGKTQLAFVLGYALAGQRRLVYAPLTGHQNVYMPFFSAHGQPLLGALGEDVSQELTAGEEVPATSAFPKWAFPKTARVLGQLLFDDRSDATLQQLRKRLHSVPISQRPLIVLDEVSAHSRKKDRSMEAAPAYYASTNLPLMLRQLFRFLGVPLIYMGTNARAVNALWPAPGTGGDDPPYPWATVLIRHPGSILDPEREFGRKLVGALIVKAREDPKTQAFACQLQQCADPLARVLMLWCTTSRPRFRRWFNPKSKHFNTFLSVAQETLAELDKQGIPLNAKSAGRAVLDAVRGVVGEYLDDTRLCHSRERARDRASNMRALAHFETWREPGDELEGRQMLVGAAFSAGHADLTAPNFSPVNSATIWHDPVKKKLRWGDPRGVVLDSIWSLPSRYRCLKDDPLFHLALCGGVVSGSHTFARSTASGAIIGQTAKEMWCTLRLHKEPVFAASSAARRRDGDVGEAFVALAVVAASHALGLTAQPTLEQFVHLLAAQLSGRDTPAHLGGCNSLSSSHGLLANETVGFCSPINTPWSSTFVDLMREVGINLGDVQRMPPADGFDITVGPSVRVEVKNHEGNYGIGDFAKIVTKTAEGSQPLSILVLNKPLAAFRLQGKTQGLLKIKTLVSEESIRILRGVKEGDGFAFELVFGDQYQIDSADKTLVVLEGEQLDFDLEHGQRL